MVVVCVSFRNEADVRQRLQWKPFYSNSLLAAVDLPEVVILKMKIEELETSEKHLKQQVMTKINCYCSDLLKQ